jgi:cytoskeletal protein CcmA (bactofilin family)
MRRARSAGIRAALLVTVTGALLLATAAPAAAASARDDEDPRVSVTGPIRITANERADDVVSVDGSVRVDGVVDGDVFVVHGNVLVTEQARVTGSVTVLRGNAAVQGQVADGVTVTSGRAVISDTAVVDGDVRSSKRPDVASGARISGDVEKTDFATMFTIAGWVGLALLWLAATVTLLIVGLLFIALFPRAALAASAAARGSTGISILWAAILGIGIPIVAGLLSATVVALPLGLGLLLALALVLPLGYVVASLVLGRLIARQVGDIPAFLIGFAILRAVALIPGLGFLVGFLAAIFGLGALAVAAWRAGRAPREPVPASPAEGAPPPVSAPTA